MKELNKYLEKIEDLLKKSNFVDADDKTTEIFKKHSPLSRGTLIRLDEMWVEHSHGKYGFSVQAAIYNECGYYEAFIPRVGWEKILEESDFAVSNEFAGANLVFVGYSYGRSNQAPKGNMPTVFSDYSRSILDVFA
ncbi:GUN4 domain-containing protein [Microcystis aeruginosa]|uniref:GUN4-like protein n=1 Tax=Microcystis aeruginosa NIES-3807 TaxID=2517785 RepID=A0AAD3AZ08_MICAE|nr:GUN4 domain-containing protein [Microcystis aeruginosa]GCL58171.1 GUN4-like protein [Microcystis aeruginosa NIES-3807]